MLTPQEAAVFARTDLKNVSALVEAGRLHSIETAGGPPAICLNSLIENETGSGATR
jgi:hypothetical protein